MNPTDSLHRRRFLQLSAATTVASAFGIGRISAADEAASIYQRIVPANKGLDPEWVASLFSSGHPADAPIRGSKKGGTLDKIGMTVGGIACGTVYLNGDGRLFVWDVFNQHHEGVVARQVEVPESMRRSSADLFKGTGRVIERNGANFIDAPTPDNQPNGFVQDFALRVGGRTIPFDASGWAGVDFDGRWPLGSVSYRDPAIPLEARLDAWSPFIPGRLADSSLPVTVMEFTLRNPGDTPVSAAVIGRLGNAVCRHSLDTTPVERHSELRREDGVTMLVHRAGRPKSAPAPRPDIPFENFEHEGYGAWVAEGQAFGKGPVAIKDIPAYQGDVGGAGQRVVNSHASAPGGDVAEKDGATGTLTSPEFEISRRFIRLRIGGGAHQGKPASICSSMDNRSAH